MTNEERIREERARMWLQRYWPEREPHGNRILEDMILAIIKAKGEEMAAIGRYVSDSEAVWLLLDKHAADVPEVGT